MKNRKFPIDDTYDYHSILDDPIKTSEFITRRIDQKIDWFFANRDNYLKNYAQADWREKVIDFFYGEHLDLNVSAFGHIIAKTDNVLIIDWENECPILKRCLDQKIDLKMVCSTLYNTQYQALLTLIDPGLFFSRNYKMIRPEHQYCREIIYYHSSFEDELAICHLKNLLKPSVIKKILKYHLIGTEVRQMKNL
jgi:hypothetical protein